jgi:hypothetical protein
VASTLPDVTRSLPFDIAFRQQAVRFHAFRATLKAYRRRSCHITRNDTSSAGTSHVHGAYSATHRFSRFHQAWTQLDGSTSNVNGAAAVAPTRAPPSSDTISAPTSAAYPPRVAARRELDAGADRSRFSGGKRDHARSEPEPGLGRRLRRLSVHVRTVRRYMVRSVPGLWIPNAGSWYSPPGASCSVIVILLTSIATLFVASPAPRSSARRRRERRGRTARVVAQTRATRSRCS